jgi:hypothetical protein
MHTYITAENDMEFELPDAEAHKTGTPFANELPAPSFPVFLFDLGGQW